MKLKEEALFTLKFDGKPVYNELGELEKKLNEVKEAQKNVEKGTKEWASNKDDLKQLEAAIKNVREELGVQGMTVNQLNGYYRQLNREIKDLTPGTEAYQKKAADLKEVNDALANHRQTIRGVADEIDKQPSLWDRAKASMAAFFTVAALIEVGRMILNFFVDSVKEFRQFQSAAADMSAQTGITGKALDYLKQQAKEFGPEMGKSAAEMLEAYKLVGSANSELTKIPETLAEVTKSAITLSQAAKMDLGSATSSLVGTMNQFNAATSESGRYMNAMAAGAQAGSAEISDLASSMKASGTTANAANLTIEETTGILASLSKNSLKGEQAGTALRNVLLKLMAGAKETNPAIVGMDKALENLAKQQLGTTEMTKLFGSENINAAMLMVQHRTQIQEFTKAVTGTSAALQMAATNNATLDHELDKMKSTLSVLSVDLVMSFLPAMTKGVQAVVAFVNVIRAVPEFLSENRTSLIALGVAILAFNGNLIAATAASIAHAAAEKARTVWTNAGTTAQWLLNAAMTANPIGLVIAGVALLVAGFTALYNNSETVRAGINGLWQLMKTAAGVALDFVKAFLSMDFKSMADAMLNGGSKVAESFSKGYNDKINSEKPKTVKAHEDTGSEAGKAHATALRNEINKILPELNKDFAKSVKERLKNANEQQLTSIQQEVKQEQAKQNQINKEEEAAQAKTLKEKQKAAEAHRKEELKKAAEAAKKEAEEAVKANNDGLKQIETLRIASIKDDLTRSIATIRAKRDAEVEAMTASKASAQVKAVWEQALNEQMIRDIAKATSDAATKKAAEEAKHRADREKLERDTSNAVAEANYNAAHQALEHQLQDETLKISKRKAMNLELINLERNETLRKIADQYAAELDKLNREKADAIRTAQEKGQTIDGLENQFRQQYSAAELDRRTRETAAENAFQNDKREIERVSLEARKANQQAWFTAIKGLMTGDFAAFTSFLSQKLAGEKKQLTDAQKAQVAKIDAVGQYAQLGAQALTALSTALLNKELSNINKEKTTQLAAWKEKYDKGLISKDQYEKGVDSINKEADQKNKQAQLEAWKRQQKIDIAVAIVSGLLAVLKSFAMFGWPLGLISAAGAAIATGVSIAKIKSTQPPSMARGGKIRNAGVPDGPRHGSSYGNSGLSITRRDTGEEVAEMEGGEPVMVLSRNTYKNNKGVVDRLMHSSLHRNGAPVFASGGIMLQQGGEVDESGNSGGYNGNGEYNSNETQAAVDSSGSYGTDNATTTEEVDSSVYQEAVDKSTAQMDAIMKNTAATVDALQLVIDGVKGLLDQAHTDSLRMTNTVEMQLLALQDSSQTELRRVQTLLTNANAEADRQSVLLRIISEKNLSVSVQSIVSVWNQIDVVIDKSNFK